MLQLSVEILCNCERLPRLCIIGNGVCVVALAAQVMICCSLIRYFVNGPHLVRKRLVSRCHRMEMEIADAITLFYLTPKCKHLGYEWNESKQR